MSVKTLSPPARLVWPDLAKGVGILLMSIGHSAIPSDYLGIWIYSFHMPLFFFLSGWFFSLREGSVVKTIRHKAFPILMPYVTYSVARWLWDAGAALMAGTAVDFAPLLGMLLQWPGTPYAGSVWFFTGLFAAECLFALLLKAVGDRPLPLVGLSFVLAGCAWAYALLGGPRLPWHVDAACLLLPYLALGHVLRTRWPARGKLFPAAPILLCVNVVCTAVNAQFGQGHIDYNLRYVNEFFTCYLAGMAGVALCVMLCRRLPDLPPLRFIGENSAVYYAVGWIGSNIAHSAVRAVWPVSGYPLLCVHLLGLWLVPVPLILFLRRFCPVLMGRRAGVPPYGRN